MRDVDERVKELRTEIESLRLGVSKEDAEQWRLKRGELAKRLYEQFEKHKNQDPRLAVKSLWASLEFGYQPAYETFDKASRNILSQAFQESQYLEVLDAEELFLKGLQALMALGVPGDAGCGIAYIRASAQKNYAPAKHLLGLMYLYGQGFKQDFTKAFALIEGLAKQGYALAQNTFALMHYYGQGLRRDLLAANRWYRLAAEQACPQAQYNLALSYDNAEGLEQNFVEAARWYRFSAEQGYAQAQYNLGVMYDNGEGLKRDRVQASLWYRLAAEQGHIEAKEGLNSLGLFKEPSRRDEGSVCSMQQNLAPGYKG